MLYIAKHIKGDWEGAIKLLTGAYETIDTLIVPLYKEPYAYVLPDNLGKQFKRDYPSIAEIVKMYPGKPIPGPLGDTIARIHKESKTQKK